MDERRVKVMSDASRVRPARTQSRHDTSLRFRNVTSWTLSPIEPSGGACPDRRKPVQHNSLKWWAHLNSNQGPTDYEGKTSRRHFKVFLEMAPILLSRVSTSVQGFHGVA